MSTKGNNIVRCEATQQAHQALLDAIKSHLPQLEALLRAMEDSYEERLYRFYYQSFKVYGVQELTARAAVIFMSIAGVAGGKLNPWFEEIAAGGTNVEFSPAHNAEWLRHTRPQVEAFLHAKYFAEMMVKYGHELETAPNLLPYGWGAILVLYELR